MQVAELFLNEQPIEPAVLRGGIRRATLALKFQPVLMGSAFKNKGLCVLCIPVCTRVFVWMCVYVCSVCASVSVRVCECRRGLHVLECVHTLACVYCVMTCVCS
jgi:hypothetical protein